MRVSRQDRDTLQTIARFHDEDGPIMRPYFTNGESVQRLVELGLARWEDAGMFLIPRLTSAGRAFLRGPH